jgi:hypothetical protein
MGPNRKTWGCVPGNESGPMSSRCLKENFVFTSPTEGWNPYKDAGLVNIHAVDRNGNSLIRKTVTPDMSRISFS